MEADKKKTPRWRREVIKGDGWLELLNDEVYNGRENHLCFYGVPETVEEESTEAVLKAFFEKELNVESTQDI